MYSMGRFLHDFLHDTHTVSMSWHVDNKLVPTDVGGSHHRFKYTYLCRNKLAKPRQSIQVCA
jgi:hypothetical protein